MIKRRSHTVNILIKAALGMALSDLVLVGLVALIFSVLSEGGDRFDALWFLGATILWPFLIIVTFLHLPVRVRLLDFRKVLVAGLAAVAVLP